MRVRGHNRFGPLSEEVVRAFEKRLDITLPEEYRAFLLAHHGGVPEPNFYWVVPGDWGSGIENVYGFGEEGYALEQYLCASVGIPPDLLAIGDDGCCNYLCIGIAGPSRGKIYYVDHEFETDRPERIRLIASSFNEFIENLVVGPDY